MASSSSTVYNLLVCPLILLLIPFPSRAADPDPLQDFCVADLNATSSVNGFPCKPISAVTSEDFFFDGLSKEGDTNNVLGSAPSRGNVLSFPGLNTLGIAMNRVDFAPGGMSPIHSHPRASKIVLVIKGKLLVGFVTTNNVYYSKVLTAGQVFVIPRGLVYFQKNVGKGKALAFTAFNSHLPGVVSLHTTLFASKPPIPNEVLTKAFQVGEDVVNSIRSKIGAN